MTHPEDFFLSLLGIFENAEKSAPRIFQYRIAGLVLRLRFAGPGLIPKLTPAFRHLEIDPGEEPDFTICCWDSRSTGTLLPPPPWSDEDYREYGLVKGYNNQRIKTACQVSLNMVDLERQLGLYWVPDFRSVPYYHTITPLRTHLHWILIEKRSFIAHAAGVGKADGGVVITGKGGAGKSTAAFACLGSRLKYAGDENCVINLAEKPRLASLYSTGSLEPGDEVRFSYLDSARCPEGLHGAQKQVYFLSPSFQEDLIGDFPLMAVLVPRVVGEQGSSITPYTRGGSLFALAPGTIFQLPGEGQKTFRAAVELVRKLPCYQLNIGLDPRQIPVAIEEFLDHIK